MMTPEKIPNDLMGIRGEKALAKKATAVVVEVTAIAFTALFHAYAILLCLPLMMSGATFLDYLQAS